MAKTLGGLFLILCILYCVRTEIAPILEIPGGKIRGNFESDFYAFRGIPYAKPPTGEMRFEPPESFTGKWDGVRNGSEPPSPCMQWDSFIEGKEYVNGEEDCLYLNVFTPNINTDEQYPVIVHIHGGAFMYGYGHLYGPEKILKHNKVVYVTMNYRLGALGFLSTEDEEISGNMGLKDQNLALKWIKKNIKTFNGDPNRITLTGFSAGGASVHFHLLSAKSRGLFNTAISHSGTAFCAWVLPRNPLEKAKMLADHLGCPTDDTKTLKKCLKEKDGKSIAQSVSFLQPYKSNPFTVFGPVVESESAKDAFISEEWEQIIKEGKTNKVPWIVSYANDEGTYNAAFLLRKDENGNDEIDSMNEFWTSRAPFILFFNETIPVKDHARYAKQLKKEYLGYKNFSAESYRDVQRMFTDHLYMFGVNKSLALHIGYTEAPVYIYHYNRPLSIGSGPFISGRFDFEFGTGHGDEMFLLYETPFIDSSKFSENDNKMTKYLADFYQSILETGVPVYRDVSLPSTTDPKEWKILKISDVDDYAIYTAYHDKIEDVLTESELQKL